LENLKINQNFKKIDDLYLSTDKKYNNIFFENHCLQISNQISNCFININNFNFIINYSYEDFLKLINKNCKIKEKLIILELFDNQIKIINEIKKKNIIKFNFQLSKLFTSLQLYDFKNKKFEEIENFVMFPKLQILIQILRRKIDKKIILFHPYILILKFLKYFIKKILIIF